MSVIGNRSMTTKYKNSGPKVLGKPIQASERLRNSQNFIKLNKEELRVSPNYKREFKWQRSVRKSLNIELARLARQFICKSAKKKRERKLTEKFRKSSLCLRRWEVQKVKRNWIVLHTFLGVCYTALRSVENRKRLTRRSEHSLNWLFQVSQTIGKIQIMRKKLKETQAFGVLKVKLGGKALHWVTQRKDRFRESIIHTVENFILADMMFNCMQNWHAKLKFIQRFMKNTVEQKRTIYNSLLTQWNTVELGLQMKYSRHRVRQTNRQSIFMNMNKRTNIAGSTSIPEDIKILYIKAFIRTIIKEYNRVMLEYEEQVRRIKSLSIIDLYHRGLLNSRNKPILPIRPSIPILKHLINEANFEDMISQATRERTQWEQMLVLEKEKYSFLCK